jgi:mono/diheme cytochrome c family protein
MRTTKSLALALLCAIAGTASAADGARGRALYETRCIACHETSVHSRGKRVAGNCAAIREQVIRWSRGEWTAEEIDDVTLYLNERYYAFPVLDGRCVAPLAGIRPGDSPDMEQSAAHAC